MENEEIQIGIAPAHIPTVTAGDYLIKADIKNSLDRSITHNINFSVAGYNVNIPLQEILTRYPPVERTGNYAGVFPHIQFKRSTLPWEYNWMNGEERLPYIFLVLLKEEEFEQNVVEVITAGSNNLKGAIEEEVKPITILKFGTATNLLPDLKLISSLAHVRVQNHKEIKELNLPEETSILMAHRMIEPDTKYRAFVCYYVTKDSDWYTPVWMRSPDRKNKNTDTNQYCLSLCEWTFETIGAARYQIDTKKLKNHPAYADLKGLADSEILNYIGLKEKLEQESGQNMAYGALLAMLKDNERFLKGKKTISKVISNQAESRATDPSGSFVTKKEAAGYLSDLVDNTFPEAMKTFRATYDDKPDDTKITSDEFERILDADNNHISSFLEYNGKTLKGMLQELEVQPFKTVPAMPIKHEAALQMLNLGKVPLEHQLKAGGKIASWYQGPFANWNYDFCLKDILDQKGIRYVPDHADYLILWNENTKMLDMTYAAAWQLGRLLIMNDNKVLQELKKWKSSLALNKLIDEQNKTSHLIGLSTDHKADALPVLLSNYLAGFLKFENFPIYYLLPHVDLSTAESCKYFKIDKSWLHAFLYGVFSAGPLLDFADFDNIVLDNPQIKEIFDRENNYYGILLQSQTIQNWPHLVVKLHDGDNGFEPLKFTYVTSINNYLRLYITEAKFDTVEIYLKNENAHFAIDYEAQHRSVQIKSKGNGYTIVDKEISKGNLAFDLLYKQPRLIYKIK